MNKNEKAVDVFNQLAGLYQEKYMDVSLYGDTFDFLCNQLKTENASVLDIACGPGNISKHLLEKWPGLQVLGIDLAPNMVELAKLNNPTAEFQVLDCMKIESLNRKFDAIICGFCLPYLSKEQTEMLIFSISNCLNDGGLLYLSTMEDLYSNSKLTKGSTGDEIFMHYYEEEYLTNIMEQNNFEVIKLERKTYPGRNEEQTTDLIIISKAI